MKSLGLALGALVILLAVLAASVHLAAESGEVGVLHTLDAAGSPHATRLWVVDEGGHAWLRGGPRSRWLARLEASPVVELERAGGSARYRGRVVSDPAIRQRIDALELGKYGLAERWMRLLISGTAQAVPVRLDPP